MVYPRVKKVVFNTDQLDASVSVFSADEDVTAVYVAACTTDVGLNSLDAAGIQTLMTQTLSLPNELINNGGVPVYRYDQRVIPVTISVAYNGTSNIPVSLGVSYDVCVFAVGASGNNSYDLATESEAPVVTTNSFQTMTHGRFIVSDSVSGFIEGVNASPNQITATFTYNHPGSGDNFVYAFATDIPLDASPLSILSNTDLANAVVQKSISSSVTDSIIIPSLIQLSNNNTIANIPDTSAYVYV